MQNPNKASYVLSIMKQKGLNIKCFSPLLRTTHSALSRNLLELWRPLLSANMAASIMETRRGCYQAYKDINFVN